MMPARLLVLFALLALTGCGGRSTETSEPPETVPASALQSPPPASADPTQGFDAITEGSSLSPDQRENFELARGRWERQLADPTPSAPCDLRAMMQRTRREFDDRFGGESRWQGPKPGGDSC